MCGRRAPGPGPRKTTEDDGCRLTRSTSMSARIGPIAIACCRNRADAAPTDLFPDPDSELLRDALARMGQPAALVSWDDPDADWSCPKAVVIRSTWDSVDRPEEYLRWVRQVGATSRLVNPADVIEWNLDKTYLRDLELEGIRVVPTQWVRAGDRWDPPTGQYVIKPSISAGGRETALYGPAHAADARTHVARLVGVGHTVMVQPYLESVSDPGELSLIFVGGMLSHAVRKGPVLTAGEGVRARPWERMTFLGLAQPSPQQREAAVLALQVIERRFHAALAYARVDLLDGDDAGPAVLEIELIDPNLSLTLIPAAAESLARAICRRAELERRSDSA